MQDFQKTSNYLTPNHMYPAQPALDAEAMHQARKEVEKAGVFSAPSRLMISQTRRDRQIRNTLLQLCFMYFVIFMAMLLCKMTNLLGDNFLYIYTSFPIIMLTVSLLYVVFTDVEKMREKDLEYMACFMVYITSMIIAVSVVLQICLIGLQLDGFIKSEYACIFIPTFIIYSIFFVFFCFLFPGLVDPNINKKREALLIGLYYVTSLMSLVLLVVKLDKGIGMSYAVILMPLWFAFSVHLLTTVFSITRRLMEVLIVLLLTTGTVLIEMKLEVKGSIGVVFAFIPYLLAVAIYYFCSFLKSGGESEAVYGGRRRSERA